MTLEMARPTIDYGNLPPHVRAQLQARDEARYGPSKGKGWKAQALAQSYVNNINAQSYPQKGGGQFAGQSTYTSPSQPEPVADTQPLYEPSRPGGASVYTSPSQPAPTPPGRPGFVPKGGGTNAGESTFTSPSQPAPAPPGGNSTFTSPSQPAPTPPQISTGGVPQNQPYVGQKSFGNVSTKSVPGSKPGGSGKMPQGWQKNPDGGYIDHEGYKRSHLPSNIDKYNQKNFGTQTPPKGGGTNAGESVYTSPSQPEPVSEYEPSQPEPVEDTQPLYEPSRPGGESVYTSPSQPAPAPPGGSGFVPKGGGQFAGGSTFTSPSQPAPTPPGGNSNFTSPSQPAPTQGVSAGSIPVSEAQGSSGVSYAGTVYGGQKSYGNMSTKSVPSGGGGGRSAAARSGTQASTGSGTQASTGSGTQAATGSQGASGGTNLAAQAQAQKNDPYGMFNFNQLMNTFYSWQPGSDDAAGNAVKNTFAANMIQSGFDTQNALHLAYANQEIASQSMNQAADLEARNQALLMRDQFTYGMSKMGAEYDFQSRFAVDEANRQLLFQSHVGDIKQNQTKLEGEIQTGLINTQGTQDRLNIGAQGDQDVRKIGAQSDADVRNINTQGKVDLSKIGLQGDIDERLINAQGKVDLSKITTQGEQDRLNITAQGDQDVRKIGVQGEVDERLIGKQGEVDIEKIGAQGVVDQANITTQGKQDILKIGAQSDADVRAIGAQGDQDVRKIGAQGDVDKTNITTQGDVDVTKIGAQGTEDRGNIKTQGSVDVTKIGAQGAEDRKNIQTQSTEDQNKMRTANRLEAKTRAEQSSYARGLAGMF